MDIVFIGRWFLLAVGVLVILATIWFTLKNPNAKRPLYMWIFGVLIIGLGIFGQEFLPKYGDWLAIITDMVEKPGEKSYAAFFDSVGKEKIPEEIQKIGINYVVSHPIEGMENILNNSIREAPDNKNGEKVLEWALESYKGKQKEIDHFVESKVDVATVRQFDPTTRQLVYNKMQRLPDNQKRILEINDDSLLQHRTILRQFPTRNQ